jgi:hypothetical protein
MCPIVVQSVKTIILKRMIKVCDMRRYEQSLADKSVGMLITLRGRRLSQTLIILFRIIVSQMNHDRAHRSQSDATSAATLHRMKGCFP